MRVKICVFEIRIKVFLLQDIPLNALQSHISDYLDSAFGLDEELTVFHEENRYKLYSHSMLWPIEKEGVYKKDHIYTITIRTVDEKLARYFSEHLHNHYTEYMKGLTVENRLIPRKMIGELYTLTPVIMKNGDGYWKNSMSLADFERRLFENAVKKFNQFTGEKMNEDFQLYTSITFLNRKPIANEYKGIRLLGDKLNLKVADNPEAQEMAYFLTGTGMCEMNGRGFGYCNYRWI